MAIIEFDVTQSKAGNVNVYTDKGISERRSLAFKGVDTNGITIKIEVEGPKDIVTNGFLKFPSNAGAVFKCTLEANAITVTSGITDATQDAKKEQKPADQPISMAEIDAEIAKQ